MFPTTLAITSDLRPSVSREKRGPNLELDLANTLLRRQIISLRPLRQPPSSPRPKVVPSRSTTPMEAPALIKPRISSLPPLAKRRLVKNLRLRLIELWDPQTTSPSSTMLSPAQEPSISFGRHLAKLSLNHHRVAQDLTI